ncbi:MAG: UDP-N-acetylglucosamine diphosphorylase/glucosamine-1-phosphate N-acetyltransferase [Gammaproteobacteria bacterium CG_4_10_14_0_8_um_filter_38_16]|nr:MAG: UDP-N-acetylglucosamine diphosphorylase/glucosamine-1-phosphate N-acetyltransferase [Gammaproteobacteria bacterium CG_4_10_14_0_8_um_filter_38_16]PJA03948.1 MAG: UDP-N-acetylglucosamine diphosphorylase/glucosamine-1-phosphate N-acetyltransferase [Gammaproteobacteria bacterium CG_4_10_14_0_2_um_filter_38_22]PJB09725.1 MAG: UDP-N-acetylglucosamine diphosphorylase/glucosamine-1-phosphate N-acetyltransferase [Gammaproteobacteria bacterium CG_4_9_14_3_um_filter_38_9]
MTLSIVILAAGKGRRMVSKLPKVMHKLGGVTLLERVVKTAESLKPKKIHVVYGNGGSCLPESLPSLAVNWVFQKEQLGTGHAVMQALPFCSNDERILVLYGDVPVISTHTLQQLLDETPKEGVGLLVTELENPTGFGRIVRDHNDNIVAIIEEKDATRTQRAIKEINTGIVTAPAQFLKSCLPRLSNKNAQHEYYLTDMIAVSVEEGVPLRSVSAMNSNEVRGVNDPWQLVTLERYYQSERARQLAYSGVTIMDPARLDIRGDVFVSPSVQLDINVILEGNVTIGAGCEIGSNVVIKNSTLGNNVKILSNCVIDGAVIEDDAQIGPFAHVRPHTNIKSKAKVGNFVEIKKTTLGENSKASHLSYLGDALVGKNVNVGAGTITCNYDGVNKWPTEIDDGAFIGSNTSLVAPVKIGKNATIAAGSVITKKAPAAQLTVARAKQVVVENWKRPEKV